MINRRKNNYFEKIFFNQKFLALLGLIIIILISFPFVKNTLKQYRINKEIGELKQEISDLQNKNVDLKNFVSYLESDQFAEEQARLNLGLKKPGEEVMVIKSDNNKASTSTSTSATMFNIPGYEKAKPEVKQSNPEKWFNYFLK
ncbi:MAG: septum formation initiator family protein [Patescibacteria group bacterium]|jgi:cell division protein FtsL